MQLRWSGRRPAARCAACGEVGEKPSAVEVHGLATAPVVFVRCGACDSLTSDRLLATDEVAAELVSYYLEQGAAIDLMAAPLQRVARARRFLEAGCGFGFALDFARRGLGCEVLGVDPSPAARLGANALGVPVISAPLTPDLALGDPFDLALCSEVIEHVSDPRALLATLRQALSNNGVLWLTTPDAGFVTAENPAEAVLQALSPGHHAILFSRPALAELLDRTGFRHVAWESSPSTLRCWASPSTKGIARVRPAANEDPSKVRRYLDSAARAAPPGSALELGLAYRHFKATVNAGLLDEAEGSLARLAAAFERRHRIDLSAPEEGMRRLAALPTDRWGRLESCPFPLANALFFLGILELNGRRRPTLAATAFATAAEAGELLLDFGNAFGIYDGETRHLLDQARVHHALALARVQPAAALSAWVQMAKADHRAVPASIVERCRAQLLVEFVHHQAWTEAISAAATPLALDMAGAPDQAASALFALGLLRDHQDNALEAAAWFGVAADVAGSSVPPGSLHSVAREHARRALTQAEQSIPRAAAPTLPAAPGPQLAFELEGFWCDAHGVFLRGWAHAYEHEMVALEVHIGQRTCNVEPLRERTDLRDRLPSSLPNLRCGFEAYVAARAGQPVELVAHTTAGAVRVRVELPARPLPPWPVEGAELGDLMDTLAGHLFPGARVLVIGPRSAGAETEHALERLVPGVRVVGVDIHPGAQVDLVADAHHLDCLRPSTFDLVVSQAVMEHLAAPWLMAAEVNRMLRLGGLVAQEAPYAWPAHAAPNDFWRFSADGLTELFGTHTGFEVLAAVNAGPAALMPPPELRMHHLELPIFPAYLFSRLIARKVAELPPAAVAWPLDANASARRALSYPVDGLAPGGEPRFA